MRYQQEIQTTDLRVLLRDDGIIETRPREDWTGKEQVQHARENMLAVLEISNGDLRPTLNFLPDQPVSYEAQDYYKNHPVAAVAAAMVTTSAVQKILGNFLMSFIKHKLPARLFDEEESAVKWLNEQWLKSKKGQSRVRA